MPEYESDVLLLAMFVQVLPPSAELSQRITLPVLPVRFNVPLPPKHITSSFTVPAMVAALLVIVPFALLLIHAPVVVTV